MKTPLIAIASILTLSAGLAACGDKTAAPGAEKAKGAEAAATASNLSFDAQGVPIRKPGLWETVHVAGDHLGEEPIRQCLGDLDEEDRQQLFGESEHCKTTIDRARGGLRVHAVCSQAGVNTDSTMTLSGSDTEHTMALEVKIDNTADSAPASTIKTVTKSRWVGACPAGMQPGDLVQDGE